MNRDPVADQELLTGSGAGIIFLGSGKGAVQGFFCLVDNKVLKKSMFRIRIQCLNIFFKCYGIPV